MSNTATASTPVLVEDTASNEDTTPIENVQEVEDIQEGVSKRKRTSAVWNHFKLKTVEGKMKAQCNYCKKHLLGESKQGTNHLRTHLERCPSLKLRGDLRRQVMIKEQGKANKKVSASPYNFDQEGSREDLAHMVIMHEYPLAMVDHVGFRRFVSGLQPNFKLVSRNTLKRDILKIYDYEKQKSMAKIDNNGSRVAITTDMWTSSNKKRGFMVVTGHYINDSWILESQIMRFIYVPSPHTKEVLSTVLLECLLEWNVDRKLSTVTVDNCTTNDAMMRILLEKLEVYGRIRGSEEIEKIKKIFFNLLAEYGSENSDEEASCSQPPSSMEIVSHDFVQNRLRKFDSFVSNTTNKRNKKSEDVVEEFDTYIKEGVLKRSEIFDILGWWNHNGLKYPTLQRLARDILAIPVTTVASESAFSTSGRLLSPHRSRLHPRTLEALMCAQSWLWSELKGSSPMPEDATIQNILEDYDDHEEEESGAMELGD
uniref:BED-type domain-containing protein n=1 Tax=Fagus sylvatica TaxID=28930 RepID=A0A2N9FGB2_FAGSY